MGWRRTRSEALRIFLSAFVAFWSSDWKRQLTELSGVVPLLFVAGLVGGCNRSAPPVKTGPERRDIVDELRINGIPSERIEKSILEGLGTKPSSTFLWQHTYESFDPVTLEKDLLRIERELRRRGYYEAKVRAARIIRLDEREKKRVVLSPVRVEIEVEAGPPILIGKIETKGLAALPFSVAQAAAQENRLREGQTFDEREFENAKVDMANSLSNRGHAFAQVTAKAEVDLVTRRAHVIMEAKPGPSAKLGLVSIEGLDKLSERAVRRILNLKQGDIYSRKEIRLARSALFQLGTFSRVEVIPNLSDPASQTVPLTVRLEESSLHELKVGGGGRFDTLRLSAVAQISWTHMNFLGGLRRLTISSRPGLTFYPTSINNFRVPTNVFAENFLSIRLEQPGFVESRTRGFHEGGYNVYPLLYLNTYDKKDDPRDERVIGYNELTTSVGLSRSFFNNALDTTLSLNWQGNFPFTYQTPRNGLESDAPLIDVQVLYPELYTRLQFLDDPVEPTQGMSLSNSLQVATGLFGTLRDVRIRPEIRTFVPLDKKHKVVLASRFGVGLLLNSNYGESLRNAGSTLDLTNPDIVEDQQEMIFRAFYSGGPSSNRGYPYRRVGPQGPIAFLLEENVDCVSDADNSSCIRPLGGFTLWEASTELRFHLLENWSFVAFVDASDVSTHLATFTFTEPHIALGPGVRYHSPIGPIRLDWGIRVPGWQKLKANPNEPQDISEVPPYDDTSWNKIFAFHLLIGEDF